MTRRPQVVNVDCSCPEHYDNMRQRLDERGADLVLKPCQTEAEIVAACQPADVVVLERTARPFTGAMMAAMPRCRGVIAYGSGYDGIDVSAATDLGIVVCNMAGYCAEEVSDHVVALILASVRRILPMNRTARSGAFVFPIPGLRRVSHLTLGLVGMGHIGRAVARKMAGFRMRMLAAAHRPGQAAEPGVELVPLDRLLREADIVSLHLPLRPETRGLIGESAIRSMKPTAVLVNTGRGAVVDQDALVRALREKRLAAAALDVMVPEPLPVDSPLAGLDNVLLSPHYGGVSEDSELELQTMLVESVAALLRGDLPPHPINPAVRRQAILQP